MTSKYHLVGGSANKCAGAAGTAREPRAWQCRNSLIIGYGGVVDGGGMFNKWNVSLVYFSKLKYTSFFIRKKFNQIKSKNI